MAAWPGPTAAIARRRGCWRSCVPRIPGLPVIAYGNSTPDLDHMRRCEEAVFVNAGTALSTRLGGARCPP